MRVYLGRPLCMYVQQDVKGKKNQQSYFLPACDGVVMNLTPPPLVRRASKYGEDGWSKSDSDKADANAVSCLFSGVLL